jgi:AAA family ATPase
MSISVRAFVVHLAEPDGSHSRASRRVYVHAEMLKVAKLIAGDVVALASADESQNPRVRALHN